MASGNVSKPLTLKETVLTGTTGNTTYNGYYYVDIAYTGKIGNVISVIITKIDSNVPAFCICVASSIRVFSTNPGKDVTLKVIERN